MSTESPSRPPRARVAPWVVLASAATLLIGCAQQGPTGSRERVFAADLVGMARKCVAEAPTINDGQAAQMTMTLANDGGWCGVFLSRSGRPYDSALMATRPNRGKIVVNRVGDRTRIAYTPNQGFVGSDSFSVKLIPGDAEVKVTVTVSAN